MKQISLLFIFIMCTAFAHAQKDDFIIIVPASVSSGVDSGIRWLAPILEKELNKNIIVHNYPGADGLIGFYKFNEMPNDCNRLLVSAGTMHAFMSANSVVLNPMKEFEPIYGLNNSHLFIVVSAKSNIYNLNDFISFYKTNHIIKGGALSKITDYIISEIDSSLKIRTDIINYKNANQMAIELSENLIDYAIIPQGAAFGQSLLDTNKLRSIAVLENTRSIAYPNIKTFSEYGYRNIKSFGWNAFFVKKTISSECKKYLTSAISNVMNSKEAKEFENRPGKPILLLKFGKELQELQSEELLLFKSK